MANANPELSPALQEALQHLDAGDTVKAEEAVRRAAQEAESRHGRGSPEFAAAQNELGQVLLQIGRHAPAVEAFRAACDGPMPTDEAARRDRLTYLTNLGLALQYADDFDEAEKVLRQALDARREHYGAEHAGYAFGLETLADLYLRRRRPNEALDLLNEAVANFLRNRHPHMATALALRAEALRANDRSEPPFAGCDKLPNEVIEAMARHALGRVGLIDLILSRQVLGDLDELVSRRLGEDHPLTLQVLTAVANVEHDLGARGDPRLRERAIRRAVAAADRQGRPVDAVHGLLGLALAQSEAARPEVALAAYSEAVKRAEKLGDAALLAQARRNWGLLLADMKRREGAERQLRQALADADRAGDAALAGRARVALGTFLQHGNKPDEARPLLEEALKQLDPAHPDAVSARGHLGAITAGGPCGCGDTGEALAVAFREFVRGRLPGDLLKDLGVTYEDDDFAVKVHLSRQPTAKEAEHLNEVIAAALAEFRERAAAGGNRGR